jgi:glutamate synthase (NADPH/NADH) large chain
VLGWRDGAVRRRDLGIDRRGGHAVDAPALRGPVADLTGDDPALASTAWPSSCASGPSTRSTTCYFPSLSARTIVYKGMLTSQQLRRVLPRPLRRAVRSAGWPSCTRASPPTPSPRWPLAHPYRYLAHNGEINTLAGNRNWMRAREALLATDLIPGTCRASSRSAPRGQRLGLLRRGARAPAPGGRSLPHAVLMMIPEAWENHPTMDPARRAFYRYHASLMEPWDGPAAVASPTAPWSAPCSTATGCARPATGSPTTAGGAGQRGRRARHPPDKVVRKGRLQPGRMFLVDTGQGRIVDDDEIKAELAPSTPTRVAGRGPDRARRAAPRTMLTPQHASVVTHQRLFGYTNEELRLILAPMAKTGAEPLGSMGSDTAIAVLSDRPGCSTTTSPSCSPR